MVWTMSQLKRLKELKADNTALDREFQDAGERNKQFLKLEKELIKDQRSKIREFQNTRELPALCALEETLSKALTEQGFSRVTIIPSTTSARLDLASSASSACLSSAFHGFRPSFNFNVTSSALSI